MDDTKPEVGKTYRVSHSRKGTFNMKMTSVGDEWAEGTIVKGRAGALLHYNEKETGEEITVRISFCSFNEVKETTNA